MCFFLLHASAREGGAVASDAGVVARRHADVARGAGDAFQVPIPVGFVSSSVQG